MKKILSILLVLFSLNIVAQENELKWYTNADKAIATAMANNKPVYMFFTGSDWCGWCIKLQKKILTTKEFKSWANKNVVLLELDFPKRKKLDENLTKQNNYFRQLFAKQKKPIQGYPTGIFVTLSNNNQELTINELGRHAVQLKPGTREFVSPNTWISTANKIIKK
tara:strand:+ start:17 stop:514 length:498 start_codon:yes stop_codon:yes gene_type:complete